MVKVKIPIRIYSPNMNVSWHKRYKRNKDQRNTIWAYIISSGQDLHHIKLPCVVRFTRVSPGHLDEDNLLFSFKSIRDFIADKLIPGLAPGQADGSPKIKWEYYQEKSRKEYAMILEIQGI